MSLFAVNLSIKKETALPFRMCQLMVIMGVTHMGLLWADIGETLGMTVPEMRALRITFGDVLGLGGGSRVSECLVPIIALIRRMQQRGVSDADIEKDLREGRVGDAWPEEVLARMEAAATAAPLPSQMPDLPEDATPAGPNLYLVKPVQPGGDIPEFTARELVMDLRREICTATVEERELLHRMNQLLQSLILEVRDLRYAFLLSSSRKDRKKGRRSISRLLSG